MLTQDDMDDFITEYFQLSFTARQTNKNIDLGEKNKQKNSKTHRQMLSSVGVMV